MKKLILILFVLFTGFAFSQEIKEDSFVITEKLAEFPAGGVPNFRKMVAENFRKKKVTGKGKEFCEVKFVIDRDGSITNIEAFGTNASFNKEAIRAISKIKTKWSPAKINGQAVRYRFRLPLNIDFN